MSRFPTASALVLLTLLGNASGQVLERHRDHPVDLAVRVTWDNDRPVQQHIYVQLLTNFGVPLTSGYTDDNGRLGMGQVSGGYYRLHVSGEGIREEEEQFYVDPNDGYYVESIRVHAVGPDTPRVASGTVAVTDLDIPKAARREFEKGNQEGSRKDWKAAVAHFQAAIREYPRYAMAYNNLGIALIQSGDAAGARAAFQKALDINDHYGQAYVNLGRLLYSQNDNAEAESLMKKALSGDPRNLDALIILASAELRLGEYSLSADNARKVHDLQQPGCASPCLHSPAAATDHYSVAHFIAGTALKLSARRQDAEEQFKLYLTEMPDGPLAGQARAELISLEKGEKPPSP